MQMQALIVDDSRVARMSLKKALAPHDVDVTEANSAEEAFEYLEASQQYPDIIFMDVMMDGLDGVSATKQLKATPKFRAIPIVICTGNQNELDNENALEAGAISVLNKPPQVDLINDIITALRQQSVVVKVDKATMTTKVVEIIEQKLLPKFKQQTQQIAAEVSQQMSQSNQQQLNKQLQTEIEQALPAMKEQLLETIVQETLAAVEPKLEQHITESVTGHAQQTIHEMTANSDVSKQASDALAIQAQTWLAKQEHQMQVELGMQIGPKVMAAVEQYLDNSLAAMIAPLVTLQVEKHLANYERPSDIATNDDNDEKLAHMTKRIGQLNTVVIGLAAVVVVLAIFVLL
jgi:CheY-like chemotaxis protein